MTLRVCSLFSGIGGFEVGLDRAGFETILTCENDPVARAILRERFPGVRRRTDIALLKSLPKCDLVTAGWPCQDLSQAGRLAGIQGSQSSLVTHVFRLLNATRRKPRFVLFENVAFALHFQDGRAIQQVTNALETCGYRWAYRVLDSREFGLPHRRRRIFVLGTRDCDPATILFDGRGYPPVEPEPRYVGFYWTEGNRGIGWTAEAVPPLKGGSGLSIPSPPGIWDRSNHTFFSPGIEDAERLQGFIAGWTSAASKIGIGDRARWRLIGNAVSVPVTCWIGKRIAAHEDGKLRPVELPAGTGKKRHNMAWGGLGVTKTSVNLELEGPITPARFAISQFSFGGSKPLSLRAASGFLQRLGNSPLLVPPEFVADLAAYCRSAALTVSKAA